MGWGAYIFKYYKNKLQFLHILSSVFNPFAPSNSGRAGRSCTPMLRQIFRQRLNKMKKQHISNTAHIFKFLLFCLYENFSAMYSDTAWKLVQELNTVIRYLFTKNVFHSKSSSNPYTYKSYLSYAQIHNSREENKHFLKAPPFPKLRHISL